MKLPYWIIVFAVAYWVFACIVAHLHAMRAYSCVSLFFILTFQLTALGISIKDGEHVALCRTPAFWGAVQCLVE